MADYVTRTGLEQTFGTGKVAKVFSLDTGTVFNTAIFSSLRTRAQSWVNGKLGTLYTVPFSTGSVPDQVTAITECIVFKMAARRRRVNLPPELTEQLDFWTGFLDGLRAGENTLDGITGTQHRKPFDPDRTAVPIFRRAKVDIDGNQVNTDIVKDNEVGTLDEW